MARMNANIRIVQVCWIVLIGVWAILAFAAKPNRERDPLPSQLRYRILTLLSYVLMFTPWTSKSGLGQTWAPAGREEGIGAALAVLGVVLAIWARLSIGRNWSGVVTLKEDHRLIRTGPYARICHPIYSGIILAMAGTALVNRRWAGLLAVLMITTAFLMKVRVEERLMKRVFGSEYEVYQQHTGAFLPRF
ncbi:MAG TPA: isoprenylcysteine carboxylmethyltransferase family protein [Terriglobales bacterium]|nr:isoprenylcysteine carboxylmethyltransferase family protein [Terriglobales bacterium]